MAEQLRTGEVTPKQLLDDLEKTTPVGLADYPTERQAALKSIAEHRESSASMTYQLFIRPIDILLPRSLQARATAGPGKSLRVIMNSPKTVARVEEALREQVEPAHINTYSIRPMGDNHCDTDEETGGFVLEPDCDMDLANPQSDYLHHAVLSDEAEPRLRRARRGLMSIVGSREVFSSDLLDVLPRDAVERVVSVASDEGDFRWNLVTFACRREIVKPYCFQRTRASETDGLAYTPSLGIWISSQEELDGCVVDDRQWGVLDSRRVIGLSRAIADRLRRHYRRANIAPILRGQSEWGVALSSLARWLSRHDDLPVEST